MPPQGFFNPRRFEVSAVDTPQFAHAEMIVVPARITVAELLSTECPAATCPRESFGEAETPYNTADRTVGL